MDVMRASDEKIMRKKTRILIADGSEPARSHLRNLLEPEKEWEIIGEATHGEEVLRWVQQERPDIVIMDEEMPILDGIKATQAISRAHPEIGVIIVSTENNTEHLRAAMIAGARNFLIKPFTREELVRAIYQLIQDQNGALGFPGERSSLMVIYSLHGGMGKTMLTANLGAALAEAQAKVVTVDLGFPSGHLDLFLDLSPEYTWQDAAWALQELTPSHLEHYLTAHETGLKALCAPSQLQWMDPNSPSEVHPLLPLLREYYQFILLDLPSGLSDETLTTFEMADRVLLLITQDVPHLRDVRLFLEMLGEMEFPPEKLCLILNRHQDRTQPSRQEIEKALQREVFWCLPSQEETVTLAINCGQPFVLTAPRSPIARSIVALAHRFQEKKEPSSEGRRRSRILPWRNIVSRD